MELWQRGRARDEGSEEEACTEEARVQWRGGSELGTVAGADAAREEEEAPASPTRAGGAKRQALGRGGIRWGELVREEGMVGREGGGSKGSGGVRWAR